MDIFNKCPSNAVTDPPAAAKAAAHLYNLANQFQLQGPLVCDFMFGYLRHMLDTEDEH